MKEIIFYNFTEKAVFKYRQSLHGGYFCTNKDPVWKPCDNLSSIAAYFKEYNLEISKEDAGSYIDARRKEIVKVEKNKNLYFYFNRAGDTLILACSSPPLKEEGFIEITEEMLCW